MLTINADLHIHSRFSGGVSEKMTLELLSTGAKQKGIQLIGTGDCLHPTWYSEIKALSKAGGGKAGVDGDEGTFELNGTRFILSTEIEDNHRVHHILLFPSFSAVDGFIEKIKGKSSDLAADGRPKVHFGGEEAAQYAKDVGALIGPSHAFTPWTAIYAAHNSLKDCYGSLADYVSFMELGLSADTSYADRIAELSRLTFVTNSDAHSPYPIRLAREFNRFSVKENTFSEIAKAILRKGGRKPILNVGLPPQEGKYNETACTRCFIHYTMRESLMKKWRCKCGGIIKKGVRDRIEELATYPEPRSPDHRPPYLHLIPLAEIIAKALNQKNPQSKAVFSEWSKIIEKFGNEVDVLVDRDIEEIQAVTRSEITRAIKLFREGKVIIHPGGGGDYGKIELPPDSTSEQTPTAAKKGARFEHEITDDGDAPVRSIGQAKGEQKSIFDY
ncbi:MAG: TIGR00375 family protein [Thermoplasmata archaeon]